jgi:hypothetical protein
MRREGQALATMLYRRTRSLHLVNDKRILIYHYGKPSSIFDCEAGRTILQFIPLTSLSHSRHRLLETNDKLGCRNALLELAKAAL